jgi:hypothetical protein
MFKKSMFYFSKTYTEYLKETVIHMFIYLEKSFNFYSSF